MISPTAEYALRAVVAIAQAGGEAAGTQSIAKLTKVPPGYLPKVLQMLGRAGVVESRRGLGGGFKLARPANQIAVLEVINAVDTIKRIQTCPLELESHRGNLCPLHKRLDEATAQVERSFASTTIAELLWQPGRNTPFRDADAGRLGGTFEALTNLRANGVAATRRHEALIAFSHDHTLGLAVAKHLGESVEHCAAARQRALYEFVTVWDDNLLAHFEQEEQVLPPVIRDERLTARLQTEHVAIRANVDLARVFQYQEDIDPTWIRGLSVLLHNHIRWEERELFPTIEQTATVKELQAVTEQLASARGKG